MDNRIALKPGEILCFPGMECEIEKFVGKGSNAIVYLGRYKDALQNGLFHHVLIKELFPFSEEKSIYRNSDNSIVVTEKGEELFALQRLSFENGNKIHLSMLEKHPDKIGSNINTFNLNNTLYTVLGFDAGKSMDKYYLEKEKNLRYVASLMKDILNVVNAFHQAGYLHLDISPDNILIIGEDEGARVSLIDYNSVHSIEELKSGVNLYCSAKEGYTAHEVLSGDVSCICESSDVYSLAAVFYWLLTGKSLSFYQRLRKNPPDVRNSPLLADVPDTVYCQVMLILKRGLSVLVSKRYKNCESMKKDMEELILRIDAIGITHASVWESGKRITLRMIKSNPSLHYLLGDKLYPMRVVSGGESLSVNEALEKQLEKGPAVLCGSAGMGKTTALLHSLISKSRSYSPLQVATIYVSLFDYNGSGENFIKNRILEDLKFDKSIQNMEDARNSLIKIFNETVKTERSEKVRFLLLIDGLNEAGGDTQPLIKEILSLSEMKGVCVIITSRNRPEKLPFDFLEIVPLDEKDIRSILSSNSLIYPESPEMQEILRTPLLLSAFCKAATSKEKQLQCSTAGELLDEYLLGLCEKEMRSLAEDSEERWLIDASINLVLPYVCAHIAEKNGAVTDEELLKTVKKCFKLLSARRISYVLPQYIGHSKDIKSGAKNAEQWYGDTVVKILWYKTGLLVKESGRGYRVMHQVLQEHLLHVHKNIESKVKIQNFSFASGSVFLFAVLFFALISIVRPKAFDIDMSKSYLDSIVVAQVQSGEEISLMKSLIDTGLPDEIYDSNLRNLNTKLEFHKGLIDRKAVGSLEMTQEIYNNLKTTGKVMPWSGEAVKESDVEALLELGKDISENYGLYAEILCYLRENEDMNKRFGKQFCLRLSEKLNADAALSDMLFYSACLVHLSHMEDKDPQGYRYYWLTIGENADLSDEEPESPDAAAIEKLKKTRQEKTFELHELEIFTIYRRITK